MSIRLRTIFLLIIDALLINLAVYVALLLRFDADIPAQYINSFYSFSPLLMISTLLFLAGLKLYNRIWAYASIGEMLAIVRATTFSLAVVITVVYLFDLPGLPRSVYIGTWLLMNAFIGISRLSWRLFRDLFIATDTYKCRKVLIVGAGNAGALLAREIQNNPHLRLCTVGFIDDSAEKQHAFLYGVPILGTRKRIPIIAMDQEVDEIIIAMPSVRGEIIREIVEICKQTKCRIRILPGVYQSTNQNLYANLREVQMEDLLRRDPVHIDLERVAEYISNRSVLVTGAGGSIGSELCRQLLALGPARLVLLDNCENNLFDIEMELREDGSSIIYPELVDIKNRDRLQKTFEKHRPEIVFHAAAYKHVPMMELHPEEAFCNNVVGTRNVAEMAHIYKVKTFIQVSTDKAVNPTSVMGASKRLAELVIKDINRVSSTCFAAVRFGNVLGSRGSVIPTFMKQIEKGGPVTVTHPDMQRYFMTIPEAVQLIIEAGAMAEGGEIFVLDMGEMVKIDDLARDLIRLAGYEPDRDIQIIYTGIRPGEKLYEELFTDREGMQATRHERIFISRKEMDQSYVDIAKHIMAVNKNGFTSQNDVIKLITDLIPEYQGKNSAVG